jgi:endogenous inhibitor of DNA gyrase (YacG/DUF329 family)
VDLGNWLLEKYRVSEGEGAGGENPDSEEERAGNRD